MVTASEASRATRASLTVVGLLVLAGCDDRAKEWTGWAYPNAEDMTLSVSLSGFKTFEECQEATIGRLRQFPDPDKGAFACGYMCRWDASAQVNVCKSIRK